MHGEGHLGGGVHAAVLLPRLTYSSAIAKGGCAVVVSCVVNVVRSKYGCVQVFHWTGALIMWLRCATLGVAVFCLKVFGINSSKFQSRFAVFVVV